MAFWALDIYFPQWECLNYGAPGEGLAYVESFAVDTSDSVSYTHLRAHETDS